MFLATPNKVHMLINPRPPYSFYGLTLGIGVLKIRPKYCVLDEEVVIIVMAFGTLPTI
jgi:hypothetical protein